MKSDVNIKFTFKCNLIENISENYFTGLPDDLNKFITSPDGTLKTVIDNLEPSRKYEIKITIKQI